MAFNPFRTFQRNQKGCMAGATLLAIISFLFLGVIIDLISRGGGGSGSQIETIAECRRFGKVTNFELERLRSNQDALQRLLLVLYRNLSDPADEEKRQALAPLEAFINQATAQTQTPEQLINMWLVTQYAQEEGNAPDWDDVSNRLTQLTDGYLSQAVYDETLQAIGLSHRAAEQLLARYLRWERSLERFQLSIGAVSPATRWNWYQWLHRQVTIEAAAIPIDSLINQAGEPSNSQLNTLFEQNKTKRYNPVSAETGFVMPTELAFQYVIAEPTQELLDSITDEEMLTFYEENKETMFRKSVRPPAELPQLPGMMPGGTMPFPTPGRVLPTMPMPSKETPETPVTEPAPSQEEPAPETSAVSKIVTRLVSYQGDEKAIEPETGELTSPAPDTSAAPTTPNETSDEPVDYRPFDEVKDQIRIELAAKKAMEGLPLIQEKMKAYAATYHEHFEQGRPAPPMPDLTGLVAEQGLKWVDVPMGDVYAAMRTGLARGFQERQHLIQMFRRIPLPFESETFLGSNGLVLLWVTDQKPEKRPNKLDEVREIVLQRWKEIESRGLAQNKAEELANEVRTSGQSLAEACAGRSDVRVVETEPFTWKSFGGLNPMVAVMQRIPPRLGEVREKGVAVGDSEIDNQLIVAPGSDFMEVVFSLQVGETGVVFNQPKSVAYIVRITSSSPSTDTLWEQFQRAHMFEYFSAGTQDMVDSAYEAWLDEIRAKTGFRWVNKPDARVWGYDDEGY
jgi:hypothetical protein